MKVCAKDVMTKEVITVTRDTPIEEVAHLLIENNISAVPVVEGGEQVVGVVSEADLIYQKMFPSLMAMLYHYGNYFSAENYQEQDKKIRAHRAADAMSRKVVVVEEETPIEEIIRIMEEKKIKRVFVVSDGSLRGVVSKLDILRCISGPCEEVIRKVRNLPAKAERVADVMTRNVFFVSPSTSLEDVVRILLDNRVSGVPVVDEEQKVVGIVSESDLIHWAKKHSPSLNYWREREHFLKNLKALAAKKAADVMTSPAITIEEEASLEEVAALMNEKQVKRLPVISNNKLVGIVTRADILKGILVAKK